MSQIDQIKFCKIATKSSSKLEKEILTGSMDPLSDLHVLLFMLDTSECCRQLVDHLLQLVLCRCQHKHQYTATKSGRTNSCPAVHACCYTLQKLNRVDHQDPKTMM